METLRQRLRSIDQKGYKAYKAIEGTYRFPAFTLAIDHVQGDPFAEPSKIRVIVPRAKTKLALKWTDTRPRRVRCEDVLVRRVHHELRQWPLRARGSGKAGSS
ncbi:putative ATPase of the ABC class [Geobacillus sp. BCO2]|nr:putative ATPase of the ABC class [Geobacillus sp. BCO2]